MQNLWNSILSIPGDFWQVVGEMSPYLLLGFILAGALSVLISARTVERHLGGRGVWPVFKASLFGIPLPLCSCGVIPVGASLHRQGASRGATAAFLISTPQTGVDSILVTLSLMGVTFAIYRPLAALVSGVVGGFLVARFAGRGKDASAGGHEAHADDRGGHDQDGVRCSGDDEAPPGLWPKVKAAAVYGFAALPEDIGRSMLGGLLLAAAITAIVPKDFFIGVLSGGPVAMLAMMALGIPVYVCATASVPVAAALIARGVSPGVALVFLMTGPATNAATIATVWRTMGPRTAVLYLASVAGTAMASGLMLDYVFAATGAARPEAMGWMLPAWLQTASAVLLLGVLTVGAVRSCLPGRSGKGSGADAVRNAGLPVVELRIQGMTCNHCLAAVRQALEDVTGAESVSVDLRTGQAVVAGHLETGELIKAVESVGYVAEAADGGPIDK